MGDLFQKIVEMSLMGSVVILITVLARFLLRKRSKRFIMILWAVVAIRLLLPVNIESGISIFNYLPGLTQTDTAIAEVQEAALPDNVDAGTVTTDAVSLDGIRTVETVNNTVTEIPAEADASARELPDIMTVLAIVWLTGTAVITGYCSVRYIDLKRKLKDARKIGKNVYESEKVKAPFVFGLIVPGIYLPDVLDNTEREYILKHERTHIKHGDWISKIIGMAVVAVHWFNPLVWLAFVLFERDIEMSCDESVVANMDAYVKQAYTMSLVSYARKSNARRYLVTPLGFSKNSFSKTEVTSRVKNIINYKKAHKITAAMITAALLFVGAACSVNSKDKTDETTEVSAPAEVSIDENGTAGESDENVEPAFSAGTNNSPVLASFDRKLAKSKIVYANEYYLYARTGPGDDYPRAVLYMGGDPIVVIAETDSGWYKTDSGDYVKVELCSDEDLFAEDYSEDFGSYIKTFIGCPYEAGGEHPTVGFDDCGLIIYCYKSWCSLGIPHDVTRLPDYGLEIDPDDINIGDIICFDKDHDGVMEHCGIYVGDDSYVHVLPETGVVEACYSDVKSEIGAVSRVVLF